MYKNRLESKSSKYLYNVKNSISEEEDINF